MFKHLNKPKPDNFKIFDEYLFDDSDNGENFMDCLLFTDINNRDKLLYFFCYLLLFKSSTLCDLLKHSLNNL